MTAAKTPRRILLCTMGATPQIVTETADLLMSDVARPWRPDIVDIVTTADGAKTITERLFGPQQPWASLFGLERPPVLVNVPTSPLSGAIEPYWEWSKSIARNRTAQLMKDVASSADAERMADVIKDRLWHWVQQPETQVHLSIAGGRKTMSAHALIALTLLGRPQDEASHVLIEEAFEGHPQFWHRRQGGLLLSKDQITLQKAKHDPGPPTLDPALADITLLAVPIVPVAEMRETDRAVLGALRFSDVLRQIGLANRFRANPSLAFSDGTNTVTICGEDLTLPPVDYAKLRFLALAVKEGWDIEAQRLPDHVRRVAADDGKVFMPYTVLLGITAGRNRVREVWRPMLLKAQTVANLDTIDETAITTPKRRSHKPSAIQALDELARLTDFALAPTAGARAKLSTALNDAAESAFGSFTELRDKLTVRFGRLLANALLPRRASRPALARFRLGCPPEAITIPQTAT